MNKVLGGTVMRGGFPAVGAHVSILITDKGGIPARVCKTARTDGYGNWKAEVPAGETIMVVPLFQSGGMFTAPPHIVEV